MTRRLTLRLPDDIAEGVDVHGALDRRSQNSMIVALLNEALLARARAAQADRARHRYDRDHDYEPGD